MKAAKVKKNDFDTNVYITSAEQYVSQNGKVPWKQHRRQPTGDSHRWRKIEGSTQCTDHAVCDDAETDHTSINKPDPSLV